MNLILLSNWNRVSAFEETRLAPFRFSPSSEHYIVYKDLARQQEYYAYLLQDIAIPSAVPTFFVNNVIIDSQLKIEDVEKLAPYFSNLRSIKFF